LVMVRICLQLVRQIGEIVLEHAAVIVVRSHLSLDDVFDMSSRALDQLRQGVPVLLLLDRRDATPEVQRK